MNMQIKYGNPCITCEWNGRPYWSIVSPCSSCPHKKLNATDTYTTTTTTTTNESNITYNFKNRGNTGDVYVTEDKSPEFIKDLPTAEEYQASLIHRYNASQPKKWSEPKYICPNCKEGSMRRNELEVLASFPPKREYQCDRCGYIDYLEG